MIGWLLIPDEHRFASILQSQLSFVKHLLKLGFHMLFFHSWKILFLFFSVISIHLLKDS